MSERCPLVGMKWNVDIPGVCMDQCEQLWEEAVSQNNTDGDYDVFPAAERQDCPNHETSSLEGRDISLQDTITRSSLRIFSITDSCSGCDEEYGAQAYRFTCPYENL
jgi:hypothetical protein